VSATLGIEACSIEVNAQNLHGLRGLSAP